MLVPRVVIQELLTTASGPIDGQVACDLEQPSSMVVELAKGSTQSGSAQEDFLHQIARVVLFAEPMTNEAGDLLLVSEPGSPHAIGVRRRTHVSRPEPWL